MHGCGENHSRARSTESKKFLLPAQFLLFLTQETTAYVDFVVRHLPATERRLAEMREWQKSDRACQHMVEFCQSGWPDSSIYFGHQMDCLASLGDNSGFCLEVLRARPRLSGLSLERELEVHTEPLYSKR